MVRAAIDVGSNSVLTTVGRFDGYRWTWPYDSSKVTALGENVKRTGVLAPEAISRTVAAIAAGTESAKAYGATEILAGATMAARMAANSANLVDACRAIGVDLHILSGDREAELGFLSVSEDEAFISANHLAIIDPGGQSTELVRATKLEGETGFEITFRRSFPIGTLALLEGSLAAEQPSSGDLFKATCEIDSILPELRAQAGELVVTVGATGTNLVSIREAHALWSPDKVHGANLECEEVSKAVGWLSSMSLESRRSVVGMESGRERTLHAGALILERSMNALRAESCKVSVRGWRHALIVHGF